MYTRVPSVHRSPQERPPARDISSGRSRPAAMSRNPSTGTETPSYGSFDEPESSSRGTRSSPLRQTSPALRQNVPENHISTSIHSSHTNPPTMQGINEVFNNSTNYEEPKHNTFPRRKGRRSPSSSSASSSSSSSSSSSASSSPTASRKNKRALSFTAAVPKQMTIEPRSTLFHHSQTGQLVPEIVSPYGSTPSRQKSRKSIRANGEPGDDDDELAFYASDQDSDDEFIVHPSATRDGLPSDSSELAYAQPYGVLKMEAIAKLWGKKGLMSLYAAVYLLSCLTSLEGNTTSVVEPFFLSSFHGHSFLATISLITNISYAVGKAPMAKVLDVFGRAEGLSIAILLYSSGFITTSFSSSVFVFGIGRILSALGGQALQLAQQIMIADTSTLSNRGLLTSTISMPWLATTWIGPVIGQSFKNAGESGYRAVYLLFGLALPVVCAPLVGILSWYWKLAKKSLRLQIKRERRGSRGRGGRGRRRSSRRREDSVHIQERRESIVHPLNNAPTLSSPLSTNHPKTLDHSHHHNHHHYRYHQIHHKHSGRGWRLLTRTFEQLDMMGTVFLTIGCALVLIPLSLAATRPQSWRNTNIYVAISLGVSVLFIFAWYEKYHAKNPMLPERLLRNTTILSGCMLGFFHFACQFAYESYFTSYLQVARYHSAMDAQYIAQSYIFSACISAMVAGYLAKKSQRYKIWGVVGVLVHMVGALMMARFRGLENPTWEIVMSQVIGGTGGGFTTICAQIGVQSVVGHQDVAMSTAVFLTITQIGGAVGGAVAGSIWTTLLPERLRASLDPSEHDKIPDILGDIRVAMSYAQGTPERKAINAAYTGVQRMLNIIALGTLIPALVCMMHMEDVHLARNDKRGEGAVVLGNTSHDDELISETTSLASSV